MKKTIIALGLLASLGCLPTDEQVATSNIDRMIFIKHPNGLCFAFVNPNTHSAVMTLVPSEYCPKEEPKRYTLEEYRKMLQDAQ